MNDDRSSKIYPNDELYDSRRSLVGISMNTMITKLKRPENTTHYL